nr:hypothetical protein [Cohnella algarum]
MKKAQKETEEKLASLRAAILAEFDSGNGSSERLVGDYRVKIVVQERREYDDDKLYEALPDPDVWRLLSRADPAKVAALIKLNVITEEAVRGAFAVKKVPALQVDRE